MPAKPRKKSKPRQQVQVLSAPVPSQPTAVNVEVVDSRIKSWTPRLQFVAVCAAALAAIWAGYNYLGLPKFVDNGTFHETVKGVETKLRGQINETKDVVIDHSNKNTVAVKDDVSKVSKLISDIVKRQDQGTVERLEMQRTLIELNRGERLSSLSSVDTQLGTRKGDRCLLERKQELTRSVNELDKELERVTDNIRKARQGL